MVLGTEEDMVRALKRIANILEKLWYEYKHLYFTPEERLRKMKLNAKKGEAINGRR